MDQFDSRKPINTRKGKRYHRGEVKRVNKFAESEYWKRRKNRALQQQSRDENEVDHDEFAVPEPRGSKWTILAEANQELLNKQDQVREWNEYVETEDLSYGGGWEDQTIHIHPTNLSTPIVNDHIVIFIQDIDPVIITNIETQQHRAWRRRR
jgi:hypothetical protein